MRELNQIYNEDCMSGLKDLDDASIDLLVTDCPYLFDNGRWLSSKVIGKKTILGKGGIYDTEGMIYNEMSQFGEDDIRAFLDLVLPKLKKPNMYICGSDTQVPIYGMWAREHGLHFQILTWEKPLSIINKNRFSTNVEFVCRIYDFGTALNKIEPNEVYNKVIHTPTEKNKLHPTAKPVSMFERLILLSSPEGGVILDPFCGSGTAAIAAMRTKRNFIGFEISEDYWKIATKRVEQERQQLTLW